MGWAVPIMMLATCGLSWQLGKTRIGKLLSPIMVVLILAALLANLNVVPHGHPSYTWAAAFLVPLAIPLLLVQADLKRIARDGGRLLVVFCTGAVATMVGVIVATALMSLGPEQGALAGVFAATYIGGSVNFVSVSQLTGFSASDTLGAALAADNVISVIYLGLLGVAAGNEALGRWFARGGVHAETVTQDQQPAAKVLSPGTFLALVAAGVIGGLGYLFDWASGGYSMQLLWITLLTVVLATLFPRQAAAMSGAFPIGSMLLLPFFFVIGAGADLGALTGSAMQLLAFAAVIVVLHAIILGAAGRLFGWPLEYLIVASNACVLGPAPAAGMAASRGWPGLVSPAVLCGVFGYVVASFLGVAISRVLSS